MPETRLTPDAGLLTALAADPDDSLARSALADWLEEHGDVRAEWVRDNLMWHLIKPNLSDPLPQLIDILHEQRGRRWEAALSLSKLGAAGIPPLFAILPKVNEAFASHIGDALANLGRRAAPALPLLLKSSHSQKLNVRVTAIRCLAGMGPGLPEVTQRLIAALSEALPISSFAASAFGHDKWTQVPVTAVPPLLVLAGNRNHLSVDTAMRALGKVKPAPATLISKLVDWLYQGQHSAAEALVRMGQPALGPILEQAHLLKSEAHDHQLFRTIAEALATIGESALPTLRAALDAAEPVQRHLAASALHLMGRRKTVRLPTLLALYRDQLRHTDSVVCQTAIAALSEFKPGEFEDQVTGQCIAEMQVILTDSQTPPILLICVLKAVNDLIDARTRRETLCRCLRCSESEVRRVASLLAQQSDLSLVVLFFLRGLIADNQAVTDLLSGLLWGDNEGLTTIHEWTQSTADWKPRLAPLVGQGDDVGSPELLAKALTDKTPAVRLTAVWVAWYTATPEVVIVLLTALRDRLALVRCLALRALGEVGDSAKVRATVVTALEDKAKAVREQAAAILHKWDDFR